MDLDKQRPGKRENVKMIERNFLDLDKQRLGKRENVKMMREISYHRDPKKK